MGTIEDTISTFSVLITSNAFEGPSFKDIGGVMLARETFEIGVADTIEDLAVLTSITVDSLLFDFASVAGGRVIWT